MANERIRKAASGRYIDLIPDLATIRKVQWALASGPIVVTDAGLVTLLQDTITLPTGLLLADARLGVLVTAEVSSPGGELAEPGLAALQVDTAAGVIASCAVQLRSQLAGADRETLIASYLSTVVPDVLLASPTVVTVKGTSPDENTLTFNNVRMWLLFASS